MDEAGVDELACDEGDPARLVEIGGDEAAAGLDVGDDRRALGDRVEVVDRELDAGLGGNREQMQDAVRRAAGRSDRGDRVLERVARQDAATAARRRGRAASRALRPLDRLLCFAGWVAGISLSPGGLTPRKSSTIAIVFAVNCAAARARAGAGDALELVHLLVGDALPAACAPTTSKTSWIVTSLPR